MTLFSNEKKDLCEPSFRARFYNQSLLNMDFFLILQVWSGDTLIPGWCPLGHGRGWKQVSPVFSLVPLHLVRYAFINGLGGTMSSINFWYGHQRAI